MTEVGAAIALLAMIGIAVWLLGSFALRAGGLLLVILGLIGLMTATPEALVIAVLGALAWLGEPLALRGQVRRLQVSVCRQNPRTHLPTSK